MTNTRKWIIFLVALLVMINGAFYTVLADHDGNKEKRWYQKIFDWDDDDDHDDDRREGCLERQNERLDDERVPQRLAEPTYGDARDHARQWGREKRDEQRCRYRGQNQDHD